ncbi:MAG: plasmid pRiA4b ORF-3 family protein [Chloroflexota bacterium]|nr:plasmid pRiA4b ORF-3 family protein [Chloroflexota bacterium]
MPARTSAASPAIYQLKVTLYDSKPPIWRRIQVPATVTLGQLHRILQVVMGWTDSHLHQFIVGDSYYGIPDPEWAREVKHEQRARLSQVAHQEKAKLIYEYDFGDDWLHDIVVEKIFPPEAGKHYPVCVKGKRACPPEDCGGIWGYASFLEAISDPSHPEHAEMLEWVGGAFDPEAFDVEEVNRQLALLR